MPSLLTITSGIKESIAIPDSLWSLIKNGKVLECRYETVCDNSTNYNTLYRLHIADRTYQVFDYSSHYYHLEVIDA